ncbi:cytochrome P450, partial [Infundibulicybe gibba]
PVLPLGVPHTSTDDDVYKGYFIPKGSIVFANIWYMSHNERIYESPDRFQPERHFDGQGNLNEDDTILAFGFGRRYVYHNRVRDVRMTKYYLVSALD